VIGAKIGAGREADVHTWGDDAVVKLYRPGFGGHRAEALALTKLGGRGIAPPLLDVVNCDGRTGLVLQRLGGSDMLTLLQRQPWRMLRQARALATAHLGIHAVRVPGGLPNLRHILSARIEDAGLPPQLRDFAVRILQGLPDGDSVCHGDYHPGNVLVAADRVSVIDWVGAACGVPEADHARTLLLLRRADPLPGTPVLSRTLMTAGRSVFTHGYARAYTEGSPRPLRHVDSWMIVHTAARLSEGIDIERPILIDLLDRARHRATR
jgi:hypothetical protein